ncbi:hypothetical protein [Kitasatospora terrestris]|uniref:Cytochrome C oxidase subunit I n=1 Tax=Kitasatospora terrestris TaxID=258051 RepID=A0ABP9D882_9ACTN
MTLPHPGKPRRRPQSHPAAAGSEADRGLRKLEGYLHWQAENQRARQAARDLADLLPWLTTAQRRDLEHHYIRTHLHTARENLVRLRTRHEQLRTEYEARYRELRARWTASVLVIAVAVLFVIACVIAGLR